ncbi:hypothetical protein ACWO41_001332 [Clostridium sporogenes]
MATIHFYQANYFEETSLTMDKRKQPKFKRENISYDEFERDIKKIIKDNINNNCVLLEGKPKWSLIEILELGNNIHDPVKCSDIRTCDYIFGRIGRKKDINDIHKRNTDNLEGKDIEKDDNEDIEVFTYFYLFFEKQDNKIALAYLTSIYAPDIRELSKIISKYRKDGKKFMEITPVITKNVTNVLKNKDVINAFSYKISVPTDKILGLDGIGVPEKVYNELYNVKSTEIIVTVTAERNKNLLRDKSCVEKLKDHVYKTHQSRVRDCLIKAKNNKERLIPYHFLDNEFIEKATFKYTSDDGEKRIKEIKDKLLGKYLIHRGEILKYMK